MTSLREPGVGHVERLAKKRSATASVSACAPGCTKCAVSSKWTAKISARPSAVPASASTVPSRTPCHLEAAEFTAKPGTPNEGPMHFPHGQQIHRSFAAQRTLAQDDTPTNLTLRIK